MQITVWTYDVPLLRLRSVINRWLGNLFLAHVIDLFRVEMAYILRKHNHLLALSRLSGYDAVEFWQMILKPSDLYDNVGCRSNFY